MEAMRTAEQLEGLVRPLAAPAAEDPATSPPVHGSWVHEWHEIDGTLTACGLPAADERLAPDDGQADCPACLKVLAGERRAANAERAREARGAPEAKHGRSGADRGNVRVE